MKQLTSGNKSFAVQYNPSRIISVTADTAQRKSRSGCFLCTDNLPSEQEAMPMGERMLLLCNPYPIFHRHFTVASRLHLPQGLKASFSDFLNTAKSLSEYVIFYNAPDSGASAPDHLHFQAVTPFRMPIERESYEYGGSVIKEYGKARMRMLLQGNRSGFIIESTCDADAAALYNLLHIAIASYQNKFPEPRMNVFCKYSSEEGWRVLLIPRKTHRPSFFYAEGDGKILVSPGAADVGGIIITPRREDFDKISAEHIETIFNEVCYHENDLCGIAEYKIPEAK